MIELDGMDLGTYQQYGMELPFSFSSCSLSATSILTSSSCILLFAVLLYEMAQFGSISRLQPFAGCGFAVSLIDHKFKDISKCSRQF